jgi:BirA family biotin operon repressor/biotin-[acetyl-CoA-carboxylase] ligase
MHHEIIGFLKESKDYLSGEEISRKLKLSRAAIWKNIEELRKNGYKIEAVKHHGYRIVSSPDKLLPEEIRFKLAAKTFGKKIIYEQSLPSTMDVAFQLALDGEAEGTIVCAETQSKGRGRMGRSWVSPKGKGIYASLILRPTLSTLDVPKLTLLGAVALCEVLRTEYQLAATIKWPNDILIDGKKLAGFLLELNAEMERVRFVILGFGVNVNTSMSTLPEASTSVKHELGKNVSRVELMQKFLQSFETWYQKSLIQGFEPMMKRWKELSSTIGRPIRISDIQGSWEGVAMDLDPHGGLVIKTKEGVMVKRMTGDVLELPW